MEAHVEQQASAVQRATLPVYNLGCGGGGALGLERTLRRMPGVLYAYVNPATEMAYVAYDGAEVDVSSLVGAIERGLRHASHPQRIEGSAHTFVATADAPAAGQPSPGTGRWAVAGRYLHNLHHGPLAVSRNFHRADDLGIPVCRLRLDQPLDLAPRLGRGVSVRRTGYLVLGRDLQRPAEAHRGVRRQALRLTPPDRFRRPHPKAVLLSSNQVSCSKEPIP